MSSHWPAPFIPSPNSSVRRIFIPQTSWRSTFFWLHVRFRKLLAPFIFRTRSFFQSVFALVGLASPNVKPPTRFVPPKGQQQWPFPPNPLHLNRVLDKGEECTVEEWTDERSGWKVPVMGPPSMRSGSRAETSRRKRSVMFLHGSGFQTPITVWHWGFVGFLARELDCEVAVVPYPLAPTNNGMEVMPVLVELFKSFQERVGEDGETIVFGDSAGGQIALSLAFILASYSVRLPDQVVAISPGLDMDMPDVHLMRALDPYSVMISAEQCAKAVRVWANIPVPREIERAGRIFDDIPMPSVASSNAALNPAAGDLGLLKKAGTKVVLVTAEWDVLHVHADPFARRCEEAGVDLTYVVGQRQFHCFPVALDASPECRVAADLIVKVINENGSGTGKRTW